MRWKALGAVVLAWACSRALFRPELAEDLRGHVAVVTGGSRGAGRGFAHGLTEAGATVYITGRKRKGLEDACAAAPGPGACIPKVVDSASDASLEAFFAELANETNGLDILVNNAFSAVAYLGEERLLGKPFWETPMRLFDEVYQVGVRSHYKATMLAVPLMQKRKRGLIVNTNSPGCFLYAFNVPYGMGKCSIDKMTGDMAMELATEGIDVVSWWAGVPMQTEEILAGSLDGGAWRRGFAPGLRFVPSFRSMARTALATTLLFEGRALAALARDARRSGLSGLAVLSTQLGQRYRVQDERGLCPPSFLSLKYQITLWIPPLFNFAQVELPDSLGGAPKASWAQSLYFNVLPNVDFPVWLFKLIGGPPLTFPWPLP